MRAKLFMSLYAIALTALVSLPAFATPGVCAFVFLDANCDGIYQDGEEEPLPGWEVCIDGPGIDDCQVTSDDGAACWFLLDPGDHEVCVTVMDGFETTSPPCQTVTLDEDSGVEQVFFGMTVDGCPNPTVEKTWGSIKSIYR